MLSCSAGLLAPRCICRLQHDLLEFTTGLSASCSVFPLQQGEDLIIWEQYHYGMRDGVFLEMGALDGASL